MFANNFPVIWILPLGPSHLDKGGSTIIIMPLLYLCGELVQSSRTALATNGINYQQSLDIEHEELFNDKLTNQIMQFKLGTCIATAQTGPPHVQLVVRSGCPHRLRIT